MRSTDNLRSGAVAGSRNWSPLEPWLVALPPPGPDEDPEGGNCFMKSFDSLGANLAVGARKGLSAVYKGPVAVG